jgi:hypothetical protein
MIKVLALPLPCDARASDSLFGFQALMEVFHQRKMKSAVLSPRWMTGLYWQARVKSITSCLHGHASLLPHQPHELASMERWQSG